MDVKAIVSQMTLEEKAALCSGKNFWHLQTPERLGIEPVMVSDGPCGIRKQADAADHLGLNASVPATSYPTGSCMACSFDRALFRESGVTLGHACQAEQLSVLLGPAANIKRSPLCGRNFEYLSEDPYLTGELAASYIDGVQSQNVGVSLKHFAVNNQEYHRMSSDSVVDERTLREIYLAGFETAVRRAKPWTVMCSYNRVNGTYAAENKRLLTEILRDEWGFDGYVVSDWGATTAERVKCLEAGMDLEMPGKNAANDRQLVEAVQNGTMDEKVLDTAAERILTVVLKYLDHKKPETVIDFEADHEKARKIAAESMVLLKNDGILPLKKDAKVAFVGEFARTPRFQGGGSSNVNAYKVTSALEAAETMGLHVSFAPGYATKTPEPDAALLEEAAKTAEAADVAVVFVGITDAMESEGFDRRTLSMPENHEALVAAVSKVQKNTVVVVMCGGCITMPWLSDVRGVLYAYLGGEAVGPATLDLLFGDANPSGKLAESFPKRLEDNPSYLYYFGDEQNRTEYREGIFVGYRYYDKKNIDVLFPFGYGLSYTTFEYSDLRLDKAEMLDTDTLTVTVKVKNTGAVRGKEVVQLYVGMPQSRTIRPEKELRGFEKVELAPGEEKTVSFTLSKRAFAYYRTDIADWYAESGDYVIMAAKSSRDVACTATVRVTSTTEIKRVYTMNSTVEEIMESPVGREFIGKMIASSGLVPSDASEGPNLGEGTAQMMEIMMREMPLRSLLAFGGENVPAGLGEMLLSQLNA
ncbi:MAG: glycoside hydrolase family 3 C-terminal domain-containing protein [Acutalibacteraceae bacterium]|nr:glycoside hydrolase family 3 C-terminal domain-containing protein [Acutalibacteraceae bacterium]